MITEIAGFQLLFSDVSLGLVVNYLAMRLNLQKNFKKLKTPTANKL